MLEVEQQCGSTTRTAPRLLFALPLLGLCCSPVLLGALLGGLDNVGGDGVGVEAGQHHNAGSLGGGGLAHSRHTSGAQVASCSSGSAGLVLSPGAWGDLAWALEEVPSRHHCKQNSQRQGDGSNSSRLCQCRRRLQNIKMHDAGCEQGARSVRDQASPKNAWKAGLVICMWVGLLSQAACCNCKLTAVAGGITTRIGLEARSAWHALPLLAQARSVCVSVTLSGRGVGARNVLVAGLVDCKTQDTGQWEWGVGQQHIPSAMVVVRWVLCYMGCHGSDRLEPEETTQQHAATRQAQHTHHMPSC